MCFSLVFACLSVWGWISGPCLTILPPPPPPCPTLGTEPGTGMTPNLGGSQQAGPGPQPPFWLQSPVCVHVHVCACMYMGNLCASMYKGASHRRWGRRGTAARPAWGGRLTSRFLRRSPGAVMVLHWGQSFLAPCGERMGQGRALWLDRPHLIVCTQACSHVSLHPMCAGTLDWSCPRGLGRPGQPL